MNISLICPPNFPIDLQHEDDNEEMKEEENSFLQEFYKNTEG
jgi:hypothetical protein